MDPLALQQLQVGQHFSHLQALEASVAKRIAQLSRLWLRLLCAWLLGLLGAGHFLVELELALVEDVGIAHRVIFLVDETVICNALFLEEVEY